MNTLSAQSGEEFVHDSLVERVAEESQRWSQVQTKKEMLFLGLRPTLTEDEIEACAVRCDEHADRFPDPLGDAPADEDMAAWIESATAASNAYEHFVEKLRVAVEHIRRQEQDRARGQEEQRSLRQYALDKLTNKLTEWEEELAGTQHQGQRAKLHAMIADQRRKIDEKRAIIARQNVAPEGVVDRSQLERAFLAEREASNPSGPSDIIGGLRQKYDEVLRRTADRWVSEWARKANGSSDLRKLLKEELRASPQEVLENFQLCIDREGAFEEHAPIVDGVILADKLKAGLAGMKPDEIQAIIERLKDMRASLAPKAPMAPKKKITAGDVVCKAKELMIVEQIEQFEELRGVAARPLWRIGKESVTTLCAKLESLQQFRMELSFRTSMSKKEISTMHPMLPTEDDLAQSEVDIANLPAELAHALEGLSNIKDLYTGFDSARNSVYSQASMLAQLNFPPKLASSMFLRSAAIYRNGVRAVTNDMHCSDQILMLAALCMDVRDRLERTKDIAEASKHLSQPVVSNWNLEFMITTPSKSPALEPMIAEVETFHAWRSRAVEDEAALAKALEHLWQLAGEQPDTVAERSRDAVRHYLEDDSIAPLIGVTVGKEWESALSVAKDGVALQTPPRDPRSAEDPAIRLFMMIETIRQFGLQYAAAANDVMQRAQIAKACCRILDCIPGQIEKVRGA